MLILGLILFVCLLILFWRGVVWFAGKIGKAKGQEEKYRKYTRFLGIFIAIATVLFFVADEIYTNMQFKQLCKKEAGLKIYKKVGKVDGFLFLKNPNSYRYNLTRDEFNIFSKFKYIEQIYSHSDNYRYNVNKYDIKWYETFYEANSYKVDKFIFENLYYDSKKDRYTKRNTDDFKEFIRFVDSYQFNKDSNHFQIIEKNITHKSKYAYMNGGNYGKNGFYYNKSAIIDIDDYSILAERKSFTNYGGKFMHIFSWLGSGYGSPIISGKCGSGLSFSEFINQILQPTVQ
ncbi:MAG: hypothetical protein IJR46_07170 [Neisseriaceae bacterium]|nr:hypothetical protein [Neisseriaceae bacterium]